MGCCECRELEEARLGKIRRYLELMDQRPPDQLVPVHLAATIADEEAELYQAWLRFEHHRQTHTASKSRDALPSNW